MKMAALFITVFLYGLADQKLPVIRNLFLRAPIDEKAALQLIQETESAKNSLSRGYNGAAKMIMARFYKNPIVKLSSFRQGKVILEAAIQSDPTDAELRYIRLVIQRNAPGFLDYDDNVEEDMNYLRQATHSIQDEQLKKLIRNTICS